MTCHHCSYADDRWPNSGETHCSDCHRTWRSLKEAHCMVCHLHFSSDSTADLHAPYCTPDYEETLRRSCAARTASHKPILRVRGRKHGETLVMWSPENADGRRW